MLGPRAPGALKTFEQVHKYLSFNIFRYETERTFLRSSADVRASQVVQAAVAAIRRRETELPYSQCG